MPNYRLNDHDNDLSLLWMQPPEGSGPYVSQYAFAPRPTGGQALSDADGLAIDLTQPREAALLDVRTLDLQGLPVYVASFPDDHDPAWMGRAQAQGHVVVFVGDIDLASRSEDVGSALALGRVAVVPLFNRITPEGAGTAPAGR